MDLSGRKFAAPFCSSSALCVPAASSGTTCASGVRCASALSAIAQEPVSHLSQPAHVERMDHPKAMRCQGVLSCPDTAVNAFSQLILPGCSPAYRGGCAHRTCAVCCTSGQQGSVQGACEHSRPEYCSKPTCLWPLQPRMGDPLNVLTAHAEQLCAVWGFRVPAPRACARL